jgi:hypothetical protein
MKSFIVKGVYPLVSNAVIYLVFLFCYKFIVDIYDIAGAFSIALTALIISSIIQIYLIFFKKIRLYHFIIPDVLLLYAIAITTKNIEIDMDKFAGTTDYGDAVAVLTILFMVISQIILQILFCVFSLIKLFINRKNKKDISS